MRCPSHGSRRPHQLRNSRRTAGEHFGIIQRVLASDSEKKQLKELPKQWVCGDVMYIHKIQQHSRNVYNVSSINWKTCITCIQGMCQVYSGCFTCTSCADMVNSTAGSWSPHFPTFPHCPATGVVGGESPTLEICSQFGCPMQRWSQSLLPVLLL